MMDDIDYIPISVATLVPSTSMGVDLFQRDDRTQNWVLYRAADYPLENADLSKLKANGIKRLFISKRSRADYQEYLRSVVEGDADGTSAHAQVSAMNEVVLDVLENAFAKSDIDDTVSVVKQLGALTSEVVSRDEFAAHDLFDVLHHDYATFTHSANVAFYAAVLAAELGYDKDGVEEITIGGLLHDLGKLEIDEAILCKPGRLDEQEFRLVKRHPTVGMLKLCRRDDLTQGQLMMAYQHHERNDGRGYPVGHHADEIHPWAKICAVVDVFEALTSQRPYRSPMPTHKALELIERDSGTALDEEIVRCWKAIISRSSHS
ncbi:MAG: HD domain-containing phosphohydrolase [Planctomycetota bacterium]